MATGDPIPYTPFNIYPQTRDTTAFPLWTEGDAPTWGHTGLNTGTVEPQPPNCTEAITILEEAEYELKELLKKTPVTINIGPKSPQDYIEIALRNVQASLRALLKVG